MPAETKKRYLDRDYVTERAAARTGKKESKFKEVKVAVLKDPEGNEVRVTEDKIASFESIWAEQAEAAKAAEEEGDES